MADKELRHMSRMELIEIIYAVQQEEQSLRRENEELKSQLEDRKIRIEEAGSIAEASLDLNHIFEDAQEAAEQYLSSVQESAHEDAAAASEETVAQAREEAQRILTEAQEKAEQIRRQGEQEAQKEKEKFLRDVYRLLDENPELADALKASEKQEDTG